MLESNRPLQKMVYAALFGALTALGAFIVIPLQPIPISLQTMFCGLAGLLLGARTGALSQIIYVLLGLIGLPVFAGGKAGLGALLGPTGGYLWGFIIAALVIGLLIELKPRAGIVWQLIALVAGSLVIYVCGVLQLVVVADLSWVKSILVGVTPFILGDLLKIAAAALIASKLRSLLKM